MLLSAMQVSLGLLLKLNESIEICVEDIRTYPARDNRGMVTQFGITRCIMLPRYEKGTALGVCNSLTRACVSAASRGWHDCIALGDSVAW